MAFKKCIVEFDHETGTLKDLNGTTWNWAGCVLQPYEEPAGGPLTEDAIVKLASLGYTAADIVQLNLLNQK